MTEEVTLAQLAAEMAQFRQQLETINQRLDMIYGAITRLADQTQPAGPEPSSTKSGAQAGSVFSAEAMMSPGSMLDALRRHATQLGMDVSEETVERLKGQTRPPMGEESTPAGKEK